MADDPTITFTSVLYVSAIALAAPILVNLTPRLRMPAVVLEIVLGIVVGPAGFGWIRVDVSLQVLSLIGLALLLFLAGLEIDPQKLRGDFSLILMAFGASLVIALGMAGALHVTVDVGDPAFVAIMLASTSLGLIVPVLGDAGETTSRFGQLVLGASITAEFGSLLLLSVFFSTSADSAPVQVGLLVAFAVLVMGVGTVMLRAGRSTRVESTLLALEDTSAQLGVRVAVALLILCVALATELGQEAILGAFVAGALLTITDTQGRLNHPAFRRKIEAIGYGFVVPIFFVVSGAQLDVRSLVETPTDFALVPLFAAGLLVARGIPVVLYRRLFGGRRLVAGALLQSTSLTFIVIAASLGQELEIFDAPTAAAAVVGGLLTVVLFPPIALRLLGDSQIVPEG